MADQTDGWPTDEEAREHMRRNPDHVVTIGFDDEWICETCEDEEESTP